MKKRLEVTILARTNLIIKITTITTATTFGVDYVIVENKTLAIIAKIMLPKTSQPQKVRAKLNSPLTNILIKIIKYYP